MTALEIHTPLETLLLFQSLDPSASDPPSFARISDSLKNNSLLRESESYNPARLEPEPLTQLYLLQMKEEARAEINGHDKGATGSEEQPPKWKPLSPLLNTLNEASRHTHLLPSLLNRLYFQYRNHAIKAIEDDEYKYRLLQKDIQEINRGEWDERLQLEEATSKKDSGKNGINSIQDLLRHDSDVEKTSSEGAQQSITSPQHQNTIILPPTHQRENTSIDLPKATAGDLLNTQAGSPEYGKQKLLEAIQGRSQGAATAGGPQPAEALKLSPTSTKESQQFPITQDKPQPRSVPSEKSLPFLPPRQPSTSGYPLTSSDVSRRIPYPLSESQSSGAPSPSPRIQQTPLPTHDRSTQPPITLPPLAGMLRSSGSPLGPLDNLSDMSGQQQYRPNSTLPSPRPVQQPAGQSHPIQLPQPRNYPIQVFPYYDTQQPYGVPYPYGHIPHYHNANQIGMPPYQAPVPSPSRGSVYGSSPVYHSPAPSYSQYPAYSPTPSYHPTPVQPQFNRSQASRFSDQSTPVSGASDRRRPPRPSPIDTSTTSTRWKNAEISRSAKTPGSPIRPRPEEISPLSEKAPSPFPEVPPSPDKPSARQSRRKAGASSSRAGASRGYDTGAASAASSTATGTAPRRTRSQSLLSHADELSRDNNPSQIHNIKPEPPATPAGDEDASIAETTADEGSRKSTRRRRETLRGHEMTETNRTGTKRKRCPPVTPVRSSSPYHSTFNNVRANHVFGSRNFPRTSATIMNDITAHKLASMFAKPITEREAPGYKDLIFRPQDLKSIKSAIVAGSKALVSAGDSAGAPAFGDVGSPAAQAGGGTPNPKSASIWIPATADVTPPKGIVNSAQLEKELMRMFANAIMFNPDPKRGFGSAFRGRRHRQGSASERRGEEHGEDEDAGDGMTVEEDEAEGSVVKDTREMFEAVERGVADWRAAERAVEDFGPGAPAAGAAADALKGPLARLRGGEKEEDGDVDELAGEEVQSRDEEDVGGGKRRRR